MIFNTVFATLSVLVLAAAALLIALKKSERFFSWFDDLLDPIREYLDRETEETENE